MTDEQPAALSQERLARIERIRASQVGVVQPDGTILFLLAEVDRLRVALAWHADERHYSTETVVTIASTDPRIAPIHHETPEVMADYGERARSALRGEPTTEGEA